MGKTKFYSLKESAERKAWVNTVIGRPDRPRQFTYIVDELPRNLESLAEYRKRKEQKNG